MWHSRRRRRDMLLLLGLIIAIIVYVWLVAGSSHTSASKKEDETGQLGHVASRSKATSTLSARAEQAKPTAKPKTDADKILTPTLGSTKKPRELGVSSYHTSPLEAGQLWNEVTPDVISNGVAKAPVAWVPGIQLELVRKVLTRLGFSEYQSGSGDWDFLWSFAYPFTSLKEELKHMKPTAKINHIPGIGFISNKQQLIKVPSTAIPKAFEIPRNKEAFLKFARLHPEKLWIQKNYSHRGIEIKSPDKIKLTGKTIVQEYIANPLLIDGRRFDIGVYTVITSLSPLRVYILDDVSLFRFCPKRYYPLSLDDRDTYVVKPGYKNTVQIPELAKIYHSQNGTYKQAFNTYLRNKGMDPDIVWGKVANAIRKVVYYKHAKILSSVTLRTNFTSRQLFELLRFDFILDGNLNVYLMEVNMSPALTNVTIGLTPEMYQHVIYSTLKLVGVAAMAVKKDSDMPTDGDTEVFQDWCAGTKCKNDCNEETCAICKRCLLPVEKAAITDAYREHVNRGGFRRVFPPRMTQKQAINWTPSSDSFGLSSYSDANRMMYMWFIGMCRKDVTWCS